MSAPIAIIEDCDERRVTVAGCPDSWGSAYPTTDPEIAVVYLDTDASNAARILTNGGDGTFAPWFMLIDRTVLA